MLQLEGDSQGRLAQMSIFEGFNLIVRKVSKNYGRWWGWGGIGWEGRKGGRMAHVKFTLEAIL